ncbi:MAG TPA: hypothetical protein VGL93_24445 [Streptosporangiaceae bacterium]|jgi:hypothetical protein
MATRLMRLGIRAAAPFGAAAIGLTLGLALAPGAAAAASGWEIGHTNAVGDDNELTEVAATGAGDAWAVGSVHRYQGTDHWYEPLLQRYDGSAWKRATVPAGPAKGMYTSVDATSASNAWVWETGWVDQPSGALRWNGSAWRFFPVTGTGASRPDVATLPSGQAWVVTPASGASTAVAYWNGTALRTVKAPAGALNTVDARTANDAWAGGNSGGQPLLAHWNGTAWKKTAVPRIPITGEGTDMAADVQDVKVLAANDVWAVGRTHSLGDDPDAVETPFALHWNGTKWTYADKGVAHPNGGFTSVASDGSGGVWMSGRNEYLTHYAKGQWTTAEVARDPNTVFSLGVAGLSRVPGTARVLGVGSVDLVNDPDPLLHEGAVFTQGG